MRVQAAVHSSPSAADRTLACLLVCWLFLELSVKHPLLPSLLRLRFYFVSDPTLLEILSLGSDPPSVVPHFQSGLFDSLSNVTFDKVGTWVSVVARSVYEYDVHI